MNAYVLKRVERRPLPVFLGTDQPETCRECGARTNFVELSHERQLHECLNCARFYIVEFETDAEI